MIQIRQVQKSDEANDLESDELSKVINLLDNNSINYDLSPPVAYVEMCKEGSTEKLITRKIEY